MREKGQTEVAKTLETPVFSRGIEILTEKTEFMRFSSFLSLWGMDFAIFPCRSLQKNPLREERVKIPVYN